MKKEDILLKAQREGMLGIDEGTKQMKNHGRLIGQVMFCFVFIVIALLAMITENKIDYGVRAMFLGYLAGETFIEWRFKKSKVSLLLSIAAGFMTVLSLIEVACSMFGVEPGTAMEDLFVGIILFLGVPVIFAGIQAFVVYKCKRHQSKWVLPCLILITEILLLLATFSVIRLPDTHFLGSGNGWYNFLDYVQLLLCGVPVLFLGMPIGSVVGTMARKKCST